MGLRKNVAAEWLTRAQCRSRSGMTPSKARAPSNTIEPSQQAWVRGPMMRTSPACQSSSKNVQVAESPTLARCSPDMAFSRAVETSLERQRLAGVCRPGREIEPVGGEQRQRQTIDPERGAAGMRHLVGLGAQAPLHSEMIA